MKEVNQQRIIPFSLEVNASTDLMISLAARVFESAQECICITNSQGQIYYVNPAFTRTTGYSAEEVLGKNPKILKSGKHRSDFYQAMWRDLFEKGQWQGEIWNRRKNGQIYPEWLNIHAVRDETSAVTHFVAIFRDITVDMKMRKELELAGQLQRSTLRPDFNHQALKMQSLFSPYHHVSGDFYDYRWDEEKQILRGFLLDVMGHGMATALQVSALRVLFRQAVEKKWSLAEQMQWLNQECFNIMPEELFAGVMLFRFDLLQNQLTYVMAGINHFLLYSHEKPGLRVVSQPGLFLGISESEKYEENQCILRPCDGAIFLTDGFFDRIKTRKIPIHTMDIQQLMGVLQELVQNKELSDDATALAFYVQG